MTYSTVTFFCLLNSCIVVLYKGESVLAVMGRILKAVSKSYVVQLHGPNYIGVVLLASVRSECIGCNWVQTECSNLCRCIVGFYER
jgi:hypothetical protein